MKVYGEEAVFNFPSNFVVYYPQEDSFFSHNERKYLPQHLSEIAPAVSRRRLPAVVDVGDGAKVAIAESDVETIPACGFTAPAATALAATFPPYPLKEKLTSDRDYRVIESADYIAVTRGTRTFPWRVIGIADKDGDLLTNQIVYLLEKPSQVQDTSWIKPGKVAWDWWNANNVYGVDFKAGINTADLQVLHRLRREIWYPLHHSRRRLVQARERAGSRSRNQHGRTRCLRQAEECWASFCGWSGKLSTTN